MSNAITPITSDLERIQAAFADALSPERMAVVDTARLSLRIARSGLDAARNTLAAISQGDHDPDVRDEATAAYSAAERDAAEAQNRANAARAAVAEILRPALARPIEDLRDLVLSLISQIEVAMDPMMELQSALVCRGLPVPQAVAAAGLALNPLREMRRLVGRGANAQRLINAAEAFAA
ncbi:hypothetical protein AAFN86_28235 [Roseomonas sp. CAU 1739]|uniref:hypothetical protein n=1 Tax=Roseomonas sp. CAU 1739 TaxID=3140364 RepID=UPI00325AB23D